MSQLNHGLALIGGLILVLSLGTGLLRSREYLPTEPILALAFGVAIGPHGVDALRLTPWGEPLSLLEQVARLTIAIAVTSIALRLPPEYYLRRARSLAVVLGPVMGFMWLASAVVAYWALSIPPWIALLVGAIVTPTDPVLANAIVTGETAERNVPERLRYLISGEAGINDGAAYLFVFLPVLALTRPMEAALVEWTMRTVVREVIGGIVLGFAVGGLAGIAERRASEREFLEETSVFTVAVALTFAVLGTAHLFGTNGILAVFVAGVAYHWRADPRDEAREQRVEEVFNRLFTLPAFVLFGMALPWAEWAALGWRGPALVIGVLLLRRLPIVLALRGVVPQLDTPRAASFVGWFGPIGVAAIFYGTLSVRETGHEIGWIAASLVVAGSVLAHGMTATPLTLRYGRSNDRDGTDSDAIV